MNNPSFMRSALLRNTLLLSARWLVFFRPHRFLVYFYRSSFFRSLGILPEKSAVKIASGYAKNLKMVLDIGNNSEPQETYYWLGFHEVKIQRWFAKAIKKGSIIYDIGAYIGFYSLLAGRLTGPTGKVYAFEPIPHNVERIKTHILLNGMQEIISCIPKVVSDKTDTALCYNFGRDDWFRYIDMHCENEKYTVEKGLALKTVSLDDFVFQECQPPPALIKIDVEGAEGRVLRGAVRLLKEFRPVIICELHHPDAISEVYARLEDSQYKIEKIAGYNHIVARPKEQA